MAFCKFKVSKRVGGHWFSCDPIGQDRSEVLLQGVAGQWQFVERHLYQQNQAIGAAGLKPIVIELKPIEGVGAKKPRALIQSIFLQSEHSAEEQVKNC